MENTQYYAIKDFNACFSHWEQIGNIPSMDRRFLYGLFFRTSGSSPIGMVAIE